MSVINWDTSPSWATEYGVVGKARHPVWANENVFQYLSTGVMAKFGADYYSEFYDGNSEIYKMVEVNPLYAATAVENNPNKAAVKSDSWTASHYDWYYTLTEDDIKLGKVKIDPYFVNKVWQLNSKDDTGVLFHNLKTLSRFGDKNDVEREIKALYNQTKRMAELYNVDLK